MANAAQVIFRKLTSADFYNINKPKGSEAKGGGQSYIDFPTSAIKAADWEAFFKGEQTLTTKTGPYWRFDLNSLGIGKAQKVEIGQRRDTSFNIRAQKLGTAHSNRVLAWRPQNGFPALQDPTKRVGPPHLVIYLIRTQEGEFWAGWFQAARPQASWPVDSRLKGMFSKPEGNIYLAPAILFDSKDGKWPFRTTSSSANAAVKADNIAGAAKVAPASKPPSWSPSSASGPLSSVKHSVSIGTKSAIKAKYKQKTEEEVLSELFADDLSAEEGPQKKTITIDVIKRNVKIVAALKQLYGGQCQISGDSQCFKKINGQLYSEAHHLVPLGEGGSDSPYNLIVVGPLIHRMLHYADVAAIDLTKINGNKLEIQINGKQYTINWHPKHAELVNSMLKHTV